MIKVVILPFAEQDIRDSLFLLSFTPNEIQKSGRKENLNRG
jgi:hypothetical protein